MHFVPRALAVEHLNATAYNLHLNSNRHKYLHQIAVTPSRHFQKQKSTHMAAKVNSGRENYKDF